MKSLMRNSSSLFPAIPSLLDEFLNRDWRDSSLGTWRSSAPTLPAVNVREDSDELVIELAAPGMKREDFKVELDNDVLTISSEQQESDEASDQDGNYTRKEFSYHAFQRSFQLPANKVKGNEISAKYIDGILRVVVPKTEDAKRKPARHIAVA
jgi:HSP20 family protein